MFRTWFEISEVFRIELNDFNAVPFESCPDQSSVNLTFLSVALDPTSHSFRCVSLVSLSTGSSADESSGITRNFLSSLIHTKPLLMVEPPIRKVTLFNPHSLLFFASNILLSNSPVNFQFIYLSKNKVLIFCSLFVLDDR